MHVDARQAIIVCAYVRAFKQNICFSPAQIKQQFDEMNLAVSGRFQYVDSHSSELMIY